MTEIYLHIVARMADYMATHPWFLCRRVCRRRARVAKVIERLQQGDPLHGGEPAQKAAAVLAPGCQRPFELCNARINGY